jgi:hypothetical protein
MEFHVRVYRETVWLFFKIKKYSVQSVYCNIFSDFFQADFTALLDSQLRDEIKTF